jgi:signal transduction histidine kinase
MEPSPSVAPMNESDKVKILLVDDQPAKLLTYEVVLAGIGETLVQASSALEAFECLLRNDIALILIDVCMPDLNGFELARMIREHPRFHRTGIIFVSAVMTTNLDQLRGYELGAFDYVPVPVVPEVLRAKVKVFVDLHRKTRHLERLNAGLEERVLERSAALRRLNEQLEQRIEERTREREKALAQLFESQKMDTIGQLIGEVAHDFNNLLMAVLGSLTLLQKRLPEDPKCRRLLHNAVQGGQRGATLARRLLAFSRRQELKPESVDIGRLVCGMEDLLTRALGFDIELECQFPSTLPPVLVDVNQLEVALLNIALNARDAMPGGGRLLISALEDTVGSGAADFSLSPGDYVRLRVVDTGAGMDEVTRAKATEPFFTTKCAGMGAGLGLSVAQGIAAQSKGMLRINSAPNLGTTVELWLPQSNTCPASVGRELEDRRAGPGVNAL